MSQPAGAPPYPTRGRVLVVDDDAPLAEMLGIVLRQEGFDSQVCGRGDAALTAFRDYRPDVVLLDVMLPGRDGIEVCRQIKADEELRHTLVVMLSGQRATAEHQAAALTSGADGFLAKPLDVEHLLSAVRRTAIARQLAAA